MHGHFNSADAHAQALFGPPESETTVSFFDPLPLRSYDLIGIDPPWPFATWSAKGQGNSADGIAREHSRKLDEFYQMITDRTAGLRRADLFAREKREGWDAWGDEVEKFSSAPSRAECNR